MITGFNPISKQNDPQNQGPSWLKRHSLRVRCAASPYPKREVIVNIVSQNVKAGGDLKAHLVLRKSELPNHATKTGI